MHETGHVLQVQTVTHTHTVHIHTNTHFPELTGNFTHAHTARALNTEQKRVCQQFHISSDLAALVKVTDIEEPLLPGLPLHCWATLCFLLAQKTKTLKCKRHI